MRSAFYPGSFDPPTLGHRDIMRRALLIFDRLVVGVGVHPAKQPMFSDAERVEMLEEELRGLAGRERGRVAVFRGLAVDAAREHGAAAIIRGLRDSSDCGYELRMAGMNAVLAPGIETCFLAASPEVSHITATLVRQIAGLGGDVSAFVSEAVAVRVKNKAKV